MGATLLGPAASSGGGPVTNTATTPSLNFPVSGAVLKTSPVAGDDEVDANGISYWTHATNERGVVDAEQFVILNAAYTLTSQTAAQKLFNATTNGALTLSAKTYEFECVFTLSALSSTSGSFGFALGGTAVLASQAWQSLAAKTVSFTGATSATNATSQTYNTAANTNITLSGTNTNGVANIKGVIRVTTGGTLIPQVSLTVAAAAIVGANSFFRIWPVGNNTVATVGNWS